MKIIRGDDVRAWLAESGSLSDLVRSFGETIGDEPDESLGISVHLEFVIRQLIREHGSRDLPGNALDSIPFHSLCRGLYLPLSGLTPERAGQLFRIAVPASPDAAAKEALLEGFLSKPIGLSVVEKVGCILGDPFQGKRATLRRDSMLRLLRSLDLTPRSVVLDRLTRAGDVAVLFAESRKILKSDPPLTAREVLESLRFLPKARTTKKFDVLRSLLDQMGRLEAYFLAKLLLRSAGFGYDYQGPLIAKLLGQHFRVPGEAVEHAMALTDAFHVARVLETEGPDGLRKIQLQPLVPLRPALAAATTDEIERYPVFVERKYDGIRLMLHKSTDTADGMLCGAYTRNRGDWLELIPGMDATIKRLPARSAIVDGELFGTTLDLDLARPATVYEVYAALQGEPVRPVQLRFAAFDLLYVNGSDLTKQPLRMRRQWLSNLIAPLAGQPTPIPFSLSEGQLVHNKDDLNRLYHHFRSQGYEGIIAKDFEGAYHLATRDPSWAKRKPEITLDLVLLGGVFAVTSKERAGVFGSYVIGARTPVGGFEVLGDVAGVDQARDMQIQNEVWRLGLLTGRRIERPSASGVRPGVEFRPQIVVTVKFEGINRDKTTRQLSLRDPKIALIRSDKSAFEADTTTTVEQLYLDQTVG